MGMFFTKDNRPFFSADGKVVEEIKTQFNPGPEILIESEPSILYPGKYYFFGNIKNSVLVQKLFSYTKEYLEIYSGEFTILEGGSIKFPASILWSKQPEFKPGFKYQFEIKNGIGHFIEIKLT